MENQYNYYNQEDYQRNYQNSGQPEYPHREHKEKKQKKALPKVIAIIGLAVLFGVVSSATFLTSNMIGNKILGLNDSGSRGTDAKQSTPINSSAQKSASAVTTDVSEIVESVMPSVVSITNLSVQQVQSFFEGVYQQEIQSAGTGIIISQTDEELLIVTNNHVIADSETLTVTFANEASVEANVKGADSVYDIAVIAVEKKQVSSDTMDAIAVATLGDSNMLKVGEPAIAIGNALGYGQSVTTGVISAVNRQLNMDEGQQMREQNVTSEEGVNLIQTDAAINPGNSGGALVNLNGEVVGINSSKLAQTTIEGMGYAIPISDVSDIIDTLMNQKTKRKVAEDQQGYIGIRGYDVTAEISSMYQMPEGVYINEVTKGSGAEKAGITQGNIITAVNGSTVKNMEELKKELTYYAAGETVTLSIHIPENNGEYTGKNVEVVLGKTS